MENLPSTVQSLEERFHALFLGNVAASILTTPEGLIVDCNDELVRMFGFDSRSEVLAKTAWDFYLDRADREAFISPYRVVENLSGEELVLRHKSGASIYVIGTRMVASRNNNRPELVLGTSNRSICKIFRCQTSKQTVRAYRAPRPDWPSNAGTQIGASRIWTTYGVRAPHLSRRSLESCACPPGTICIRRR